MLVVLTLIGVLAGLALPNFNKMLDSFEESTRWRTLENEIDGLPLRAFNQGTAFSLTTETAPLVLSSLPDGWQINVTGSVRYQLNGWCEGGNLTITANGQAARLAVRQYSLVSPRCTVGGK